VCSSATADAYCYFVVCFDVLDLVRSVLSQYRLE